ncbi:WD-40 repeat protein, partial [Reticulomyxa filosa]
MNMQKEESQSEEQINSKKIKRYKKMTLMKKRKYIHTNFYPSSTFDLELFHSAKLLKTFTGHTNHIDSIDLFTFDGIQYLCSGSRDDLLCVWDVETTKQIQSFDGHSHHVFCVKFSNYYYRKYHLP